MCDAQTVADDKRTEPPPSRAFSTAIICAFEECGGAETIVVNGSMPDAFFDLNDAEFAPIKARLSRAFLEHKADLGVPFADDAEILKHVDEIAILLINRTGIALATGNLGWLERYGWFLDTMQTLADERPGQPLCR